MILTYGKSGVLSGAGQAKLNALRFDELMDAPKHIDQSTIEAIAGEDLGEEFLNIELGSWSGLDLRKLSEKAGVKDACMMLIIRGPLDIHMELGGQFANHASKHAVIHFIDSIAIRSRKACRIQYWTHAF
ncbi:MAG: hypothetical protein MZV65_02420 [Chromatiales bacterium]|nr:hypothetical protein [Chromatiales bacterium]